MRSQRYVKFLVYVVAVILVNIVGITLFFRVDLTAGNKYSLSEASRQTLTTLSEPLTIKVFFTRNLPPPHNTTERYLHDLLEAYGVHADRHFNYRFHDVTSGGGEPGGDVAANQDLAREYGIHPVQVQNIESDEVKVKQAYLGLVIIHGDMTEKISPIDSTEGLEYRITAGIRKLANKISTFGSLEEPVRARLFLSSSLYQVAPFMDIDNLDGLPDTVAEIVSRMNDRLSGKLEFETVDPTSSPERLKEVEQDNLVRLQWPRIPQEGRPAIPAGEGLVGMVLTWRDNRVIRPVLEVVDIPIFGTSYSLPDSGEIETMLEEALESLVGINDDIGYLADHGTMSMDEADMMNRRRQSPEESLANFRGLVERSYTLDAVKLAEEDLAGDFECLVIARPTEPFSDYELYQIDQYLMRGHNLALFLDQFEAVYPQGQSSPYARPRYLPIDTGLEKLLAHYGVTVEEAVVMDESCYKQRAERYGGGEQPIYFAPLIKNRNINNDPDFMTNIKGLVTMKVSPLALDQERLSQTGLSATTLFSSSDESWVSRERISFNPMFIRPPETGEERQSYPLACLLEGSFPSYFADRDIPVKEKNKNGVDPEEAGGGEKTAVEASGRLVKQGEPAKIFVMGSSQMLGDHMLDSDGRFPNSVFIMNLLDTLNNRDRMAMLRSKQQAYNPVDDVSGPVKSLIKWVNIAGLPVMVILSGLLVMLLRAARKRRIRMMFAA